MGAFFGKIAGWIGLNVIAPILKDLVAYLVKQGTDLFKKWQEKKKHSERASQASQGNANYENNPNADTFGESP